MQKTEDQIERELDRINEWYNIQELLALYFSKKVGSEISRRQIFDALFISLTDTCNLEWRGDLWDLEMNYEDAVNALIDFDFAVLNTKIQSKEQVLPKSLVREYKVRIKAKGLIWIIHKYDKDPFPSNPHAHEIENNIKLDLSNGKCYKLREHVYTIRKKDLLTIRNEAEKIFDGELPALTI